MEIPFVALSLPTSTPMATSTPLPTLQATQSGAWYQNPTPVPSLTPTPQGTMVFPVLRTINEQEDGKDSSGTSDQPLLPLAAAALGTSVLLAAASRREEKQALDGETAPPVKVSTLAALAGVVKESFDGIWNEAVRISPADAPTVSIRTYYVGTEDPAEYLKRLAEMKANTPAVVSTGATGTAGKVIKKPSVSTTTTYQDYLYGTSTTKGVIGTATGNANSGQKKTTSVANAKSTTSSTSYAAKTSSSTKATTTTSSGGVLNWISDTAKSVVNTVKSVVTTVAAAIPSTVNKVVNYVKEKSIPPILSGVGYLSDGEKSIQSGIHTMSEAIQSIPKVIETNVVDPFMNFCRTIPDFVVKNIADPMAILENNTKESLSKIPDFVKTNVADPLSKLPIQAYTSFANALVAGTYSDKTKYFREGETESRYSSNIINIYNSDDPVFRVLTKDDLSQIAGYDDIRGFIRNFKLGETNKKYPIAKSILPGGYLTLGIYDAGSIGVVGTEKNILDLSTGEIVVTPPKMPGNSSNSYSFKYKDGVLSIIIIDPRPNLIVEKEGKQLNSAFVAEFKMDATNSIWKVSGELSVGERINYQDSKGTAKLERGFYIRTEKYTQIALSVVIPIIGFIAVTNAGPVIIGINSLLEILKGLGYPSGVTP